MAVKPEIIPLTGTEGRGQPAGKYIILLQLIIPPILNVVVASPPPPPPPPHVVLMATYSDHVVGVVVYSYVDVGGVSVWYGTR